MISFAILHLLITPVYCWTFLWTLGYHGVFAVILCNLFIAAWTSLWDLFNLWTSDYHYVINFATWINIGNNNVINFAISGTFVSTALLVIMTCGSFVVLNFVYIEMWDDKEGANFAILLTLFLGFMGILVASSNLFMFYLGWEGIGLVSLFLINFWSERARAIKATLKVYTINKIGDFFIFSGICLLFVNLGQTDIIFLNTISPLINNYYLWVGNTQYNLIEIVALLFVIGGGVKSAQLGFHIWLLEAMEAPLGASALMHSSTLVVAGIILVYKLAPMIAFAYMAHYVLIIWGSWTALFAAFTACFQFELKIILAYSTISSMGFMYCLLGLHAYSVMLNYLIIHAFIKIFLFLIIGAIMLHCNGCQDIRWMGGLLHYIPHLYIFYFIGSCGLAGLPYWSGYYCKSATWFSAINNNYMIIALNFILLITTLCTYIYLLRLGTLVFLGTKNGHRSIYRRRFSALSSTGLFIILSIIVGYTGIVWTHMCDTLISATQVDITNLYQQTYQYITTNYYSGWWLLTFIYITSYLVLLTLYLLNINNNINFLYYLYYYFIFSCGTLFIYICL